MKTVLAPIDFSSVTDTVVNEAAALTRSLGGRLVLLTALQPLVLANEYPMPATDVAAIAAAGERTTAKNLERLAARLAAESIPTEVVQVSGAPVAHIVDQAEKLGANYIVMGSHGHTAIYDLLVGSTTHGVLLRAKCPVVIVPPQKKKPAGKK